MDGRVKTLHSGHPRRHPGAPRIGPTTSRRLRSHGITPVDLVVVNLYPFVKAAAEPGRLLRRSWSRRSTSADPACCARPAKNFRDVLVVVDPEDYPRVLEELGRDAGPTLDFRFELMQKAFAHTAMFDGIVTMAMRRRDAEGRRLHVGSRLPISHGARRDLRYGENPHQKAHWLQASGEFGARRGRSTRARSSPTRTCSISTRRARIALEFTEPAAASSSSTRIPAGSRRRARRSTPTFARVRPIRSRPSAASSV